MKINFYIESHKIVLMITDWTFRDSFVVILVIFSSNSPIFNLLPINYKLVKLWQITIVDLFHRKPIDTPHSNTIEHLGTVL